MKKIDIAIAAGLVLSIFLSSFTSFAKECGEVRENVVRLHILANSDSDADQALKLKVRDRILAETGAFFAESGSKTEAAQQAASHLDLIERAARDELAAQGCNYPVEAELVSMYFETRAYGDVTLPAGRYDAVRVKIGEAEGRNWWCVLFPPLCIPAASESGGALEEQIASLGQRPRYVPKFAVLELAERLHEAVSPQAQQ